MPPRGAAFGGVPGRAATRPAAGTGDRDDRAPRRRSSTPSARPPTRSPTECRRGADKSPPPRPTHQLRQREARGHAVGALDEQIDCRGVDSRADVQRGHRPHLLVGDAESFPAGGQNPPVAECARIASIRSAAASRTCSQLSNTSSRTRPSSAAATARSHSSPVVG